MGGPVAGGEGGVSGEGDMESLGALWTPSSCLTSLELFDFLSLIFFESAAKQKKKIRE